MSDQQNGHCCEGNRTCFLYLIRSVGSWTGRSGWKYAKCRTAATSPAVAFRRAVDRFERTGTATKKFATQKWETQLKKSRTSSAINNAHTRYGLSPVGSRRLCRSACRVVRVPDVLSVRGSPRSLTHATPAESCQSVYIWGIWRTLGSAWRRCSITPGPSQSSLNSKGFSWSVEDWGRRSRFNRRQSGILWGNSREIGTIPTPGMVQIRPIEKFVSLGKPGADSFE